MFYFFFKPYLVCGHHAKEGFITALNDLRLRRPSVLNISCISYIISTFIPMDLFKTLNKVFHSQKKKSKIPQ